MDESHHSVADAYHNMALLLESDGLMSVTDTPGPSWPTSKASTSSTTATALSNWVTSTR